MPIPSKQSAASERLREKSDSTLTPRDAPTMSLLPCPFGYCDNHGGKVVVRSTLPDGFQVFCNSCNARGPVAGSRSGAIAAWNRRSDPIREKALAALKIARDYVWASYDDWDGDDEGEFAEIKADLDRIDLLLAKASRDSQPEGEAELKSE